MQLPYSINMEKGLLEQAEYYRSPNCDNRPQDVTVDLLVIHNISLPPDVFEGDAIKRFFLNELDFNAHPFYQSLVHLKVSAHLLIRRCGKVLQFVPFNLRAWHAGVSSFQGQSVCNDFSIGIELEGSDNIPYTGAQYKQLGLITQLLMKSYPAMTTDRIVGHQTIAPDRKTDPGPAFNWDYFFKLLEKEVTHEVSHTSNMPCSPGVFDPQS